MPMDGATLAALAAFGEADLRADCSAGDATPELGPPDESLRLDEGELDALYQWFDLGWRVLDVVTSDPVPGSGWSTIQLWPEHFDVGTGLDLGSGQGVNLGFSPGDAFSHDPYVYLGPWRPARPGDPGSWDA